VTSVLNKKITRVISTVMVWAMHVTIVYFRPTPINETMMKMGSEMNVTRVLVAWLKRRVMGLIMTVITS
jgi:hypothetical protein